MGICIMFSETMGVVTSVWRLQPSVKNSDPRSGILLNLMIKQMSVLNDFQRRFK